MDEGARLGVSMNHKVKLHGVRKYTQDQPGVEDGKQKHHTGLPGARKSREDAKRNGKEKSKRLGTTERDIKRRSIPEKPNTPPAHWYVQS